MRDWGFAFLVMGMGTSSYAWVQDTSVVAPVPAGASALGITIPDRVANVALLQQQMMTFNAGLALALLGGIFFAVGVLLDRLKDDAAPGARPSALEPLAPVPPGGWRKPTE